MKIKPQIAIIITVIIFFAGIGLTSVMGHWTTESTKVPKKLESPAGTTEYDPADIRGSYTFGEVSKLYNVPLEDLAKAFGVEQADAAAFQCKGLESKYADAPNEIGTGSVRLFVAFYGNLPFDLTEDTYLPETALTVLKEKATLTPDNLAYAESHVVKMP